MCRPEMGFNCVNTTETPFPRMGHLAVVYKTYDYEFCAKFVEIDICADFNEKNLTCPICVATDENRRDRYKLVSDMK